MKNWNELTHFAGLDWAGDHHDVAVVDQQGTVVAKFRFAHRYSGGCQVGEEAANEGKAAAAHFGSNGF
jgi:hypothetical protein